MKSNKNAAQKRIFLTKGKVDVISLIVALLSLVATVGIGIRANEIAERSQPLDYSVTVSENIEVFSYKDEMYSTGGVEFRQLNVSPSGDYSSVFLSTLAGEEVDVVHIPRERNERIEFAYEANNGLFFYLSDENPNLLVFSPADMAAFENTNKEPQSFHLLFKGYNREFTIYSLVYTIDGEIAPKTVTTSDGEDTVLAGKINCYIIDEDNLYDPKTYLRIVEDLDDGSHYTADDIFDSIIRERKLCYEKLKLSH